ncbi:hypothetical protein thsps21_13350 [Pseudomonas sp. No.21]|uniref:hypothetical protein n=1 Tax=Pseudomonas TaxID=286 RepID=UPI000DAA370A|nr:MULTISPECIES: hypothetical protein [Pseudomonas]MDW3716672.1 hypothetical protein [Pseudomonas sp. 2023EL-01195]PZE12686.1 hypothetical protein DMX10_14655 [Pseudomonas sp. 57B-090624]GJN44877.1 hypothetical protein TUM20249_08630 [Pseudomonas tohonis]
MRAVGAIDPGPILTVASAATTDIGAARANTLSISGTTGITSFGTAPAGTTRWLTFQGVLTITYNATSMILPGLANITTVGGDTALFVSLGGGNWRCMDYMRVAAMPALTIDKGLATAWVNFNGVTMSIKGAHNVASVTRVSAGVYTINFVNPMANANYAVGYSAGTGNGRWMYLYNGTFNTTDSTSTKTTTSVRVMFADGGGSAVDNADISVIIFGGM